MLLSMTGFGKAVAEADNKKITVEVKSLNSKQLDLTTRVSASLRSFELEMRNMAAHALQRGKADLTATLEASAETSQTRLSIPALKAYRRQVAEAAAELGIPEPADLFTFLMRFPDVTISETDDDVSPELHAAAIAATTEALDQLVAHRRAEGQRLEEFFSVRIKGIADLLEEIKPFEDERVPRIRARLEECLAKIPGVEFDKGRLEQEMIFYLEKLDVNEEHQRLSQHLRYFMETMAAEPGQGKKLGFIAQEMGREINTLGSKSNHAEMQKIVVKMKDILEQIKEQVLNVM